MSRFIPNSIAFVVDNKHFQNPGIILKVLAQRHFPHLFEFCGIKASIDVDQKRTLVLNGYATRFVLLNRSSFPDNVRGMSLNVVFIANGIKPITPEEWSMIGPVFYAMKTPVIYFDMYRLAMLI